MLISHNVLVMSYNRFLNFSVDIFCLTVLKFRANLVDMDNMTELTIIEIAGILKMHPKTVTARLNLHGIKEKRKVGRTNVYDPAVIEIIRHSNPVGHPPKQKPPKIQGKRGRPRKANPTKPKK